MEPELAIPLGSAIIGALAFLYVIYSRAQDKAIEREKLAQKNRESDLKEREQERLEAEQQRQK